MEIKTMINGNPINGKLNFEEIKKFCDIKGVKLERASWVRVDHEKGSMESEHLDINTGEVTHRSGASIDRKSELKELYKSKAGSAITK